VLLVTKKPLSFVSLGPCRLWVALFQRVVVQASAKGRCTALIVVLCHTSCRILASEAFQVAVGMLRPGECLAGGGAGKAVDFSSYGDGAGNVETGTRGQPGTGGPSESCTQSLHCWWR